MKFKPGDICVADPQYSFACYLIKGIRSERAPIQYDVLSLKNNSQYYMKESELEKIGEVLPELGVAGVEAIINRKPQLPAEDSLEVLIGRARAKKEFERGRIEHRSAWQFLAKAKPGDSLQVRSRYGIEKVTFHYVLERGEKYVWLGEDANGKLLRYMLTTLIVPT